MKCLAFSILGACLALLTAQADVIQGATAVPTNTFATSTTNAPSDGTNKLDRFHAYVHDTMQKVVEKGDGLLVKEGEPRQPVPPTRLRLGLYGEINLRSGNGFKLSPVIDTSVDVKVPNLESKMKVFLTTIDPTSLPGVDTVDADKSLRAGVSRSWWDDVDTSVGVKVKWLPQAYADASWSPVYTNGCWKLYPRQQGSWESGNGFGEISSFIADRWNGAWVFRTVSAIQWSQDKARNDIASTNDEHGWQWEQTLILGYVQELIDEREYGRIASGDDLARGGGSRLSLFGGPSTVDIVRFTVFYKAHLYKRWLYFVVGPEIEQSVATEWNPEFRIKVGVDALFWGEGDR